MTELPEMGGVYTMGRFISGDGLIIAGQGQIGNSSTRAFVWSATDGLILPTLLSWATYSEIGGLSRDGNYMAATMGDYGQNLAFRWSAAYGTQIVDPLSGDDTTIAPYISGNGQVIAAESNIMGGSSRAVRWTAAGGTTPLGDLGYGTARVSAINYDGSVIVGYSDAGSSATYHPYRWVLGQGMTDLTLLPGGNYGIATHVNDIGDVVVGYGDVAGHSEQTWRWVGGVLTQISDSSLNASAIPTAMSPDGKHIVIRSQDAITSQYSPIIWHEGQSLVTLAALPSDISAIANAVSSDGRVVVGYSTTWSSNHAVRWVDGGAPEALDDMLLAAGVDVSSYASLDYAHAVTSDGQTIVVSGDLVGSGNTVTLLVTQTGVTTPGDLSESLAPALVPAAQSMSALSTGLGLSLFTARNAMSTSFATGTGAAWVPSRYVQLAAVDGAALNDLAPAGGTLDRTRYAFYAQGSFGAGHNNDFANKSASGSTGVLVKLAPALAVGAGLIASQTNEETALGGSSHASAVGASALLAYEPATMGLRLYGSAAVAGLDVTTNRFYLNAGIPEASHGETDGIGYALGLRAGYAVPLKADLALMPYGELEYAHSRLDAYTETGGAFPASMSKQTGESLISRLGAELSHEVTDDLTLRGRAAWGHRYTDGSALFATAASITQTLTSDPGAPNWVETGLSGIYDVSENVKLTGDIGGRFGNTPEPAVNMTLGVQVRF